VPKKLRHRKDYRKVGTVPTHKMKGGAAVKKLPIIIIHNFAVDVNR